ncbi:transglycosylase domain-containing protein [Candidatus Woesebacteria bacterium]|nr:transglycosylase domain-containing protein [Candidatus Woesebacteria bacterium]
MVQLDSLKELLLQRWYALKHALGLGARSRRSMQRLSQDKKRLVWMRALRYAAVASLALIVLGVVVFLGLLVYYAKDLPKSGEIIRRTGFSTKIYDRNGKLLDDVFADENRTFVPLSDIPQSLRDASVAIEDKDFYHHKGIDLLVFVRAPYYLITQQRIVGGSTLTQQLVKKALLSDERTIERKVKQIILSLLIEQRFSKDQILEMYLNEVPYGGTAYGVGAASEYYFGKPVQQLDMLQSAILAGLPQRPTAYSPLAGKTDTNGELLWQERTRGVLRRMKEDGYISTDDYEVALNQIGDVTFEGGKSTLIAPHFVFYVLDQLEQMYGPDLVQAGGLKVTTSLDLDLQTEAQTVVAEEIEKVASLNITNGAAMVMDPNTGEILSMVGSKNFNDQDIDGQFNVAVQGLRQPGSSIKPVVYLTLLRQGYTPGSMMIDVETTFQRNEQEKPYQPKNYDGRFRGPVSLRTSLGSSLNVPAVKALAKVGLPTFLTQAYSMGFGTLAPTQENLQRLGLSVALGGGEVHLIDSTSAFSAFANGGYRVEPTSILKVEDRNGAVLFEHRAVQGETVMTPEEAYVIDNILSDDSARTPAFGANSKLNVSPNVAVKTGTTNDQRDNWAIGWSRSLMVGVWVGNNDNSAMKSVASGVSGATPIWQRIIQFALKNGYSAPDWEVPEGIEPISVDAISGYPAHDEFPVKNEIAIRGLMPSSPDPIHLKLKLCKGENKLATDARVASGDYEEKEFVRLAEQDPYSEDGVNRWQEGIDAWVAPQPENFYKPPTEYCGDQSDVFVVLERPENEHNYDSENIEFKVKADSGAGIEKIEIIVDDKVVETVESKDYSGTITIKKGRHTVWAKAYARDGKTKDSDKRKIGTGGETWNVPTPTPTAVPTVAATATPTTAAPTPTPTLGIVLPPTSTPTP